MGFHRAFRFITGEAPTDASFQIPNFDFQSLPKEGIGYRKVVDAFGIFWAQTITVNPFSGLQIVMHPTEPGYLCRISIHGVIAVSHVTTCYDYLPWEFAI